MRHAPLLLLALAITATSFAACGVTPGRVITVAFFAQGSNASDFDTASGWSVHLTEASIVIGPIYVLAPVSQTARLERLRALLLPTAFAHGGHDDYAALQVRAEWLDEAAIDLLAGEQLYLGAGDGTAGAAEYASVQLTTPADATGPTHGHVAWVAGTATEMATGQSVAFQGGLDLPRDPLSSSVESIASAFAMENNGQFWLTIDAVGRSDGGPSWLEEAHFDRLPAPTTGTTRELVSGTQPYVAWMLAARDADSFSTSYFPLGAR